MNETFNERYTRTLCIYHLISFTDFCVFFVIRERSTELTHAIQ